MWPLAKSLDEFVKALVALKKADFETEVDEETWDDVATLLEDEDEDDEDDEDEDE